MENLLDELNSVIKSMSTILLTININYYKVRGIYKNYITCNYIFPYYEKYAKFSIIWI